VVPLTPSAVSVIAELPVSKRVEPPPSEVVDVQPMQVST
jgi:hypothetical protein